MGAGATGTVYCVEHAFTGDLLALKVLNAHLSDSSDAIVRFKREARTAAKIRSPHVVRILDADVAPELGGVPFLVMDLLEGSNLEQLSHGTALDPAQVVDWLRQVASPLDKAHRAGIVHRDLKPENLFLTKFEDGSSIVKILDFGIARIETEHRTTELGQVFGTLLYMAPEQARGDPAQIGPATDLFALGQIAYQLLVGSEYRAYAGHRHLGQMINEILNQPLETPSQRGHHLGDEFDRWFLKACHPDPVQRFPSAFAQIEALARAFGLPAEEHPIVGPPSSGKRDSSLARDSWTPAPDSRETSVLSLRPTGVDVLPADVAGETRTPTLPVPEHSVSPAKRRRRKGGILAIGILAGVALVVLAFMKSSGHSGPAPSAAAISVGRAPELAVSNLPDPAATSAATPEPDEPKPWVPATTAHDAFGLPPAAAPAAATPTARATSFTTPTPRMTASMASPAHMSPTTQPVRIGPSVALSAHGTVAAGSPGSLVHTAASTSHKPADDDPLSDQQ